MSVVVRMVLAFACLTCFVVTPMSQGSEAKGIIGKYSVDTGFTSKTVELLNSSSYRVISWSDAGPTTMEEGTYTLERDVVKFRVSAFHLNRETVNDVAKLEKVFDREESGSMAAYDGPLDYDSLIVRWSDRVYLIGRPSVPLFIAAINFGLVPGQESLKEGFPAFPLRDGDEKKPVSGKPELPEAWMEYLQESPKQVKITKLTPSRNKETYVVDKGSADGIKPEMYFIGEGAQRTFQRVLKVVSLSDRTAMLRSSAWYGEAHYGVGDSLISKVDRK